MSQKLSLCRKYIFHTRFGLILEKQNRTEVVMQMEVHCKIENDKVLFLFRDSRWC